MKRWLMILALLVTGTVPAAADPAQAGAGRKAVEEDGGGLLHLGALSRYTASVTSSKKPCISS